MSLTFSTYVPDNMPELQALLIDLGQQRKRNEFILNALSTFVENKDKDEILARLDSLDRKVERVLSRLEGGVIIQDEEKREIAVDIRTNIINAVRSFSSGESLR